MALVHRLASEAGRTAQIRIRACRGGHSRTLSEFEVYQRPVLAQLGGMTLPHLLVIAIDANCKTYQRARRDIQSRLELPFRELAAIACPDPHIELWYLSDPDSFQRVVGARPRLGKRKCERGRYKRIRSEAVGAGGSPPTPGGIEFASELVDAMNLCRAGKNQPSLKRAVDEIRSLLGHADTPVCG